ncbi:MAG: isocitrate/isopropylmalate dehydrogenase family protein [Acholeplasmatales bacterium]|nr:isocitrate/isopropylmalate dehydrogenase family protein [Acholeplasmatales bacterium]
MTDVVLFEGDGIGPEITKAVVEILEAAGAQIKWHPYMIGQNAYEKLGELIPAESKEAISKYKVALKGPVTTPLGKGFKSVNVQLRLAYDLYTNLRPASSYKGLSRFQNVDIVTVRENTEDLYIGEEHEIEGGYEAIKRITEKGSERIIRYAFEYAKTHGRKKVTAIHKSNILKNSDGLFIKVFDKVAAEYPTIEADKKIVDNMCMQLVMYPEKYDVLVAPNLYGDIISDLIAGLVGGLGLVPGANLGKDVAIFEAVHGSAPDIAGKGVADPIAMLMSACMMLDHIGQGEVGDKIRASIRKVLENKIDVTPDLGGTGTTESITKAIIRNL